MVIDDPAVLREVEAMLDRYEAALMRNDIPALDALFWPAPQARRFGATENLHGFDAISAYRRERPGAAPQRTALRRAITAFGPDVASADLEFRPVGGTRTGRPMSRSWPEPGGVRSVS